MAVKDGARGGDVARLTEKQGRFVEEYLVDLNATEAAKRAGYSEKTAYSIGFENLRKPEIQEAIQEAMDARSKRTEITQDRVLQELAAIGFARITDCVRVMDGRVVVQDTDTLSDTQRSAIMGIKEGKFGLEVKMYDKVRALEKLGEHLGLFTGKTSGVDEEQYGIVLLPAVAPLPQPPEESADG